ncbi:site-specific integrase [Blastopirellula sp. JC732]|uniref:Site-specific integrase n=1 Tax=Blastopirellula sediminis TaxID=2894196 RepID=A0A9X1MK97_9BACT|nr:site-specific integrase [Blastopirellula sediminis]MCC9608550.1 site-specific integrase [Blastopirellula sediminis]MCC9628673.1 site-specific integrase [Blastopirellula sediminis]
MRKRRVPKYCHHAPSDQAYVRVSGRTIYLGKHGSNESHEAYGRLIAELATSDQKSTPHRPVDANDLALAELCEAYQNHAEQYYRKGGKLSPWINHIRLATERLCKLYGTTPAVEFGPLRLKAFRQTLIDTGNSRRYINKLIAIIPQVFKWGASEELVPASTYEALRTVEGLKKGRTTAPETEPILPVADAVVDATLPFLPSVVADMIRIQRLTAARPGEICSLRPIDIDRSQPVWRYVPETHKTEHHGRQRVIFIGPQAQEVLAPYLERGLESHCFSPRDSEVIRRAELHRRRVTPINYGNRPGTNVKQVKRRSPKTSYSKDSYRRAIARAVVRANKERPGKPEPIPHWHPNQLRHTAATDIRHQFGLEAAQVICGHASADITQVYAERDLTLAEEIARKVG